MHIGRALTWSVADHQSKRGSSFSQRYAGLAEDVANASTLGLWQYFRVHQGAVGAQATVIDEEGRQWFGLNLASQDYLGLSSHARVIEAVRDAVARYGAHSSGSAPMGGGSALADTVARQVGNVLDKKHVLLFPTGWAAGYGLIRGLVRPHDHVVIDALAHNCLQHGAAAATPNVSMFMHNSIESLGSRLRRVRRKDPDGAILIVTEALFSMDTDGPDLTSVIALKEHYNAHLLLDIAHDFGVLGPSGAGLAEVGPGYGGVDYVIGSFSKTFASIGGFTATNDLPSSRAIQGYSGSYTFSNTLIPPQLAAINAALDIAFSSEGRSRRMRVLNHATQLRADLPAHGFGPLGETSAMVIVSVGNEAMARLTYRRLLAMGLIVNAIEFPAVRRGDARFRIQLTPDHDWAQLRTVGPTLSAALATAVDELCQGHLEPPGIVSDIRSGDT